ncbi:IclR family transcriptional regulator [Cupriavidus sp. amp6]|uniref:IclR family transcriptional regulator n=1 Tax=Cupriavidus sp. amp6 TaxID=388051 RepID=UPI000685B96D|nr:helix-turn-helix domain-containing protein [Cupriavidus sp. amp6]
MKHETYIPVLQREPQVKAGELTTSGALGRGIQILQAFTTATPELNAHELMAATGLPRPTLFRLSSMLCQAGLLRYDKLTGRFQPAPGLARLASPLMARVHIRQLAFGSMQALADRVRGQVSLGLGTGPDLVFIELAQAKECETVRPAMDSHISLSRTAKGRAYLAALPPDQGQRYVETMLANDPEHGAWLVERMSEARRDLAERGFCVSQGDLHRQLDAVAVPVRSNSTDKIYVFGCTVPSFELRPRQLVEEVGPRLVTMVRSIGAAMGIPVASHTGE